MKAIFLLQICLWLPANVPSSREYSDFQQSLKSFYYTITYIDYDSHDKFYRDTLALQDAWAKAEPSARAADPETATMLDERIDFLILTYYLCTYDPETVIGEPVYDENGEELVGYTEEYLKGYAEISRNVSPEYLKRLTDLLSTKYPDAAFVKKNGYIMYPDMENTGAACISISLVEALVLAHDKPIDGLADRAMRDY